MSCGGDLWGGGYTTEAVRALLQFGFAGMGLHRIWAACHPDNVGSRRVMEKCGMPARAGSARTFLPAECGEIPSSTPFSVGSGLRHATGCHKGFAADPGHLPFLHAQRLADVSASSRDGFLFCMYFRYQSPVNRATMLPSRSWTRLLPAVHTMSWPLPGSPGSQRANV